MALENELSELITSLVITITDAKVFRDAVRRGERARFHEMANRLCQEVSGLVPTAMRVMVATMEKTN